mgnify:CR=1 FL=1|jgi:hypothetical protein
MGGAIGDNLMAEGNYDLERRLAPQELAWTTGLDFRGLSVNENNQGGWNVVLRAWKGREPVYCMTTGEDYLEALDRLLRVLGMGNGDQLWHRDRYATGRS